MRVTCCGIIIIAIESVKNQLLAVHDNVVHVHGIVSMQVIQFIIITIIYMYNDNSIKL